MGREESRSAVPEGDEPVGSIGASTLLNPYLGTPEVPAFRGASLGMVGLVAAGAVVVVSGVPVGEYADTAVAHHGAEVWIGASPMMQQEVSMHSMPSGYLWPGEPVAIPEASPVLTQ